MHKKILRRDPDLMSVMQININDSDITNTQESKSKPEPKKVVKAEPPKPALSKNPSVGGKKGGYGNLFG